MKLWPKFLLSFLVISSGCLFWFILSGAYPTFGLNSSALVIVLVFFFGATGLSFILLEQNESVINLILSASPVFLFLEDKYLAVGIMLGIAILGLVPSGRIKKEIKSRLTFSVGEILHKGFPFFLTIFALALAAFFYPRVGLVTIQDIIPESFFERTLAFLPFDAPSDALYETSIDLLRDRFRAYERYLPAVFTFAVFVGFRTIFIILGWLSLVISWILFKMFLYGGLVKISTRVADQEYITFE